MSFKVDPGAVKGFAALVNRAHEDAQQCMKYFNSHAGQVKWYSDGGVFNPLYYKYNDVTSAIREMLQHMVRLLDAGEAELTKAASYYRTTDKDQAARMDRTYPEVSRPIPRKS